MLVRLTAIYVRVRQCTCVSVTYCAVRYGNKEDDRMDAVNKNKAMFNMHTRYCTSNW